MRKFVLLLAVLTFIVLAVVYYPTYVVKPEKDGEGPLAVYMEARFVAPEYHSPLEWWQKNHWEVVNRGDLVQADCLYCHDPQTSCNNCHDYVGAAPVVAEVK